MLCVLIVVSLLLPACRPSMALQEYIYHDKAQQENPDANEEIHNDENNEDKDNDLSPKEIDDESTDPREREREDSTQGQGQSDQPAPNLRPEDSIIHELDSSASSTETPEEQESQGSISQGGNTTDPTVKPVERKVVDIAAHREEIPENVSSVAAVGEAANIVRMLGGEVKLIATSESYNSGFAGTLLGNNNVNVLWSKSGSRYLNDSDFAKLIALNPAVCFEISGDLTFSDAQINELESHNIKYLVLPSLASDHGIREAVSVVGMVLGTCNGTDANKKAADYLAFIDEVKKFLGQKGDPFFADNYNYDTGKRISSDSSDIGTYTLYINGWDYSAKYKLLDDAYVTLEGTGLPVARTGYKYSPIPYYLALAGIANSASLMENNYSIYESILKYINPISSPNKALSIVSSNDLVNDLTRLYTSAGGLNLGEGSFRTIIVNSPETKQEIEKNPLWKYYGRTYSATGLTQGYGFTDQNGDIVISSIHGEYEILVIPTGIGSWADGSAESFLLSLWAASTIKHTVSENELESYISRFYSTFYGIDLTSSQMKEMLNR